VYEAHPYKKTALLSFGFIPQYFHVKGFLIEYKKYSMEERKGGNPSLVRSR